MTKCREYDSHTCPNMSVSQKKAFKCLLLIVAVAIFGVFNSLQIFNKFNQSPRSVFDGEKLAGFCAECGQRPPPPAVECPLYQQSENNVVINRYAEWNQDMSVWRQQQVVMGAPGGGAMRYLVSGPLSRDPHLGDLTARWRRADHSVMDQSMNKDALPLPTADMVRRLKELSTSPQDPLMLSFTLDGRYPVGSVNISAPPGNGYSAISEPKQEEDDIIRQWINLTTAANIADIKRPQWGSYGEKPIAELVRLLKKYPVKDKQTLVIGSRRPWIEFELLAAGAKEVTTSEYSELPIPPYHPTMSRVHPDQLGSLVGLVDMVVTYSSLQHAGLGRYGDPLDPHGDLKEMAKISCLLKPGGLLLLGLPVHADCMTFNLHRVYGPLRLSLMTECYRAVDVSRVRWAPCNKGYGQPVPWMVFQNMRGCAI